MKLCLGVLLFAACALGVFARAAEVHSLRWRHFASTADCQQEADALGQAIVKTTGVELYRSFGNGKTGDCNVEISYLAAAPLNLVSTSWNLFSFAEIDLDYDPWRYANLAACREDLLTQRESFERETGLTPVVAHCYMNKLPTGIPVPVLRIQAFGHATNAPYVLAAPKLGEGSAHSIAVKEAMEEEGVEVYRAVKGQRADYLFYYAAGEVAPYHVFQDRETPWEMPSAAICEEQIVAAQEVVTAFDGHMVAATCAKAELPEHGYRLGLVYKTSYLLDWQKASHAIYSSFESCHADREHIIEVHKDKLGMDVKGAVCGRDEKHFSMWLFASKK